MIVGQQGKDQRAIVQKAWKETIISLGRWTSVAVLARVQVEAHRDRVCTVSISVVAVEGYRECPIGCVGVISQGLKRRRL
jgi:hypothetical protein